jgi:hypothetical protein
MAVHKNFFRRRAGRETYLLVPRKPGAGHISELREVGLHLLFVETVRDATKEEDTTLSSLTEEVVRR